MIQHSYEQSFSKKVSVLTYGFNSGQKKSANPFTNSVMNPEDQMSKELEEREIRK